MACEIQKSRAKTYGGTQAGAESIVIRPVRAGDATAWLRMRETLWPDSGDSHAEEVRRYLGGAAAPGQAVLVAELNGAVAGFVELSLRAYAEGCETSPVAYLEGWFVTDSARGLGVGRALLRASEEWGRAQGCTEFASDTEADNAASADAHRACGFDDVGLIRCFRKGL